MSDASPTPSRADVRAAIERALLEAIRQGGTASADDVHRVVTIPDGISRSIVGAVIGVMSREGLIVPVQFITTSRPAGHAHLMRRWRLADPALGSLTPSAGGEVAR